MKQLFFFILMVSIRQSVFSQAIDTLMLYDCYKLVRNNAPKLTELTLNEKTNALELSKISSQNYPQVSAFGKAWYQSDAMSVSFPPPVNASVDVNQFQYNAALNIDQKVFDGGMVAVQKELSDIRLQVSNLETELGLYKLNEVVNKYFFGIITLQKTLDILKLKQEFLTERKKQVESGYRQGMIKASDLDRIVSEITLTMQQIIEVDLSVRKLESALKVLTAISAEKRIVLIPDSVKTSDSLNRQELKLFSLNRRYLEETKKIQDKRYIPRLFAYGQAGYSYPGLNFFENEPAGFYTVGLKLSWNIFDWNMAKKEKQLLNVGIEKLNIQEQDFRRNIHIETDNIQMEIIKLNEIIRTDSTIINTLHRVTQASSSALDNGTITSVDYLNDLNAELKSRIDYEKHQMLKLEAMANLALLEGIEIK